MSLRRHSRGFLGRRTTALAGRGAALLALAALATGCGAAGDRPGMTILPDMMRSVPYDAYDPNPVLPGGATLLHPPEGTVPVSGEPFPYGTGTPEAERAGRELHNPLEPSRENLARGRRVFESTCQVCHGSGGEGDGPVIGRFPNPPSLLSEHTRRYADGRIYHVISRGQGIMPPHGVQVLPEDRWRLVLYVRQLQGTDGEGDAASTGQDAGRAGEDGPDAGDAPGGDDESAPGAGAGVGPGEAR